MLNMFWHYDLTTAVSIAQTVNAMSGLHTTGCPRVVALPLKLLRDKFTASCILVRPVETHSSRQVHLTSVAPWMAATTGQRWLVTDVYTKLTPDYRCFTVRCLVDP